MENKLNKVILGKLLDYTKVTNKTTILNGRSCGKWQEN